MGKQKGALPVKRLNVDFKTEDEQDLLRLIRVAAAEKNMSIRTYVLKLFQDHIKKRGS